MPDKIGVVILAGGKSVRMGYPKPFLDVNGETMLERIYNVYAEQNKTINVVMNAEFADGQWKNAYTELAKKMNIQLNPHPDYGRGFSLQLGLARMVKVSYCFVQNIDNVVTPEIIRALSNEKNKLGYTVPVMNEKRGHPILISRKIIDNILAEPPGEFKLNEFLRPFPCTEVKVNAPEIFTNLNTQDDYREFLNQLK